MTDLHVVLQENGISTSTSQHLQTAGLSELATNNVHASLISQLLIFVEGAYFRTHNIGSLDFLLLVSIASLGVSCWLWLAFPTLSFLPLSDLSGPPVQHEFGRAKPRAHCLPLNTAYDNGGWAWHGTT